MCENIVYSFWKNDNVFKNSVFKVLKGFLFLICCIFLFIYLYLKYFRRIIKEIIIWCKRMFVECWILFGFLLFNLKKSFFKVWVIIECGFMYLYLCFIYCENNEILDF